MCECGPGWLYDYKIRCDSTCHACGKLFQKQWIGHESPSHKSEGQLYVDVARKAELSERYEKAKSSGNKELCEMLELLDPTFAKGKEKTAYQQLHDANHRFLSAQRKAEKAFDKAATLRVQANEAEKEAIKLLAESQTAEKSLAEARALYNSKTGMPSESTDDKLLAAAPEALRGDAEVQAAIKMVHDLLAKKAASMPETELEAAARRQQRDVSQADDAERPPPAKKTNLGGGLSAPAGEGADSKFGDASLDTGTMEVDSGKHDGGGGTSSASRGTEVPTQEERDEGKDETWKNARADLIEKAKKETEKIASGEGATPG